MLWLVRFNFFLFKFSQHMIDLVFFFFILRKIQKIPFVVINRDRLTVAKGVIFELDIDGLRDNATQHA